MALGDNIVEESGKITGQRVLDTDPLNVESSFKMSGKYKGEEGSDIGTYWAVMRQDEVGVMYGEGQGIYETKDGKGMATWRGYGIGRFTSPGKISFRGSLFFRAPPGTLSYFNNLVGVFEYEVDEEGNCSSKVWEWT
jgi:hypothetical protein